MRRTDNNDACEKSVETLDSDIFQSLQAERVLFLNSEINAETASRICAQLLLLDLQEQRDIYLFVNSEGGNVTDTLAVYDLMQACRSDIVTIGIGEAASGAAIILSGGTRGKRYMLLHARLMLHQPQGGIEGSTRDVEIEAGELIRLREILSNIFETHTGQNRARLQAVLDRDTYMDATKAREFGLIDNVISKLSDLGL